uniref:Uncharacterized protein n=1 Tax=Populus alba TaxID=43335 RepID=A0A4U5QD90_POPAL|nr:hypothetical protein D5086_0000103310 [Populus alba]
MNSYLASRGQQKEITQQQLPPRMMTADENNVQQEEGDKQTPPYHPQLTAYPYRQRASRRKQPARYNPYDETSPNSSTRSAGIETPGTRGSGNYQIPRQEEDLVHKVRTHNPIRRLKDRSHKLVVPGVGDAGKIWEQSLHLDSSHNHCERQKGPIQQ